MVTWNLDTIMDRKPSILSWLDVAVAGGLIPNGAAVYKAGLNASVSAGATEWITVGGVWYIPAAAVKVEVASSDNADSTQSVVLTGLTTANVVVTETLDLTGRTPVESANTYIAMNSARLVTTATPTQSAVCAGTVYVADTAITWSAGVPAAGGDLAKVFNTIPIGYWQDQDAVYTVATGKVAVLSESALATTSGLVEVITRTSAGVYEVVSRILRGAGEQPPASIVLEAGSSVAYRAYDYPASGAYSAGTMSLLVLDA